MKTRFQRILIGLSIIVLISACSKTFDLNLAPEVTVFFSNDSDKTVSLSEQDEAYRELSEWLSKNSSSWYTTSGRYPGGVYIQSGDYGIQVKRTQVVIYSATQSGTRALYTQKLVGDDLGSVKELLN